MIKAEHIPKEAADALFAVLVTRGSTRAAIAAALNAWPDSVHAVQGHRKTYMLPALILPLGEQE